MKNPDRIGAVLRARATHHHHGEGWSYSRDTGGLQHIRYKRDYTGRNHWTKRLKRATDPKKLLGTNSVFREARRGNPRRMAAYAYAWFLVCFRKDSHFPDGQINGNLVFWEEDGEYIEMVGPTVGVKIADFLEAEPENPHAIAISEEIQRVWSLRKEGQ